MMSLTLGSWRADLLSDGTFRLDGGAMFGTVPKTLWSRWVEVDAENRIELETRCLLLRDGERVVLVDAGMGDLWSARDGDLYDLRAEAKRLPQDLAEHGVAPEQVTHVILTHLHLDHAGWLTRRDGAGTIVPTFPNARHIVQRGEWVASQAPDVRSRSSYLQEQLQPVMKEGLFDLIDGNQEVAPGLVCEVVGGHTADLQMALVRGGGETLAFLGDLFPTSHHVRPQYSMAYDLYPVDVMAAREEILPRAQGERWICVFQHDAKVALARIGVDGRGRPVAEPLREG